MTCLKYCDRIANHVDSDQTAPVCSSLIDYLTINLKYCDRIANSVDPDQTAPKEQFDLGLHCLTACLSEYFRKLR